MCVGPPSNIGGYLGDVFWDVPEIFGLIFAHFGRILGAFWGIFGTFYALLHGFGMYLL